MRNTYDKRLLTAASKIGNKVKSLDYAKHIDLKYISLLEEHLTTKLRNQHNLRKKLATETNEAGVYVNTPKTLHYEEVCDFFTLHKIGASDGYNTYIFSIQVQKLHFFIVRNKWYIYIKDLLVSYYELMALRRTKFIDSSLGTELRPCVEVAPRSMMSNVTAAREKLVRLQELALLEDSNVTSFSIVDWYVYICLYTRARFNRVATFERAYAELYKRYYYVNRYNVIKTLRKRVTLRNFKLLNLLYHKLRSDTAIKQLTAKQRNNVSSGMLSGESSSAATHGRLAKIKVRMKKWKRLASKLGKRYSNTFF
jgi:hypothetical protein